MLQLNENEDVSEEDFEFQRLDSIRNAVSEASSGLVQSDFSLSLVGRKLGTKNTTVSG